MLKLPWPPSCVPCQHLAGLLPGSHEREHVLFFSCKEHAGQELDLGKRLDPMNCHEWAGHRTAKVQPGAFRPKRLSTSLLREPFVPVPRAIHNDAERPTIGVPDHENDRFREVRVKLMRGRHQEMPLKRFHVRVSLVVGLRFMESLSIHRVHEDSLRQASLGGDAQFIEAAAFACGMPGDYAAQFRHDLQ
jgi:hypothetical protein